MKVLIVDDEKPCRTVIRKYLEREKEIVRKQISALEKQIDEIVYKLYGLTKEEINVVERSLN